MKISKVYYEELRSIFTDGKWSNKRIEIEAILNEMDSIPIVTSELKRLVKKELDFECGKITKEGYYEKALKRTLENIKTEISDIIEDDVLF